MKELVTLFALFAAFIAMIGLGVTWTEHLEFQDCMKAKQAGLTMPQCERTNHAH